jgi:hypothetical protein
VGGQPINRRGAKAKMESFCGNRLSEATCRNIHHEAFASAALTVILVQGRSQTAQVC